MPVQSVKKETQRGHQTQWAAQFAVASELCKLGYEVAFTMGNTAPIADLMVVSPVHRKQFLIDVKGLYRVNPWLIKRKSARPNLFYVLAFVPKGKPNQFFVLTQAAAYAHIRSELKRLKRAETYSMTGVVWKLVEKHRDAWDVLPA
jgi:hypothetical protein